MSDRQVDRLLAWCSIVGGGSRQQFDRASADHVRDLHPNRVLSAFEVMGHLEVDWERTGSWSVNPPVLALIEGSGGNACVVGARNDATWRALKEAQADGLIATLTSVANDAPYPSSWFVGTRSAIDLSRCAQAIGGLAVFDPAQDYMTEFVGLDAILESSRREFVPSGFRARQLDVRTLRFRHIDVQYARWPAGCFEQLSQGRNKYLFVDDNDSRFVTDRWVATHAELRRVRRAGGWTPDVIRWDQTSLNMACLAGAQLPTHWSRAAIFCSGLPPTRIQTEPWCDLYQGVRATMYGRFCKALEIKPRRDDLSELTIGGQG